MIGHIGTGKKRYTFLNAVKEAEFLKANPLCVCCQRDGKIDIAEEEIVFAIEKAGGYFHDDIAPFAKQIRTGFWQRVKDKD